MSPEEYDAWYATPRGAWMGGVEADALIRLGSIGPGLRVLDVGCGTGWFSRRFAATGARVTGLDRDRACLQYARQLDGTVEYVEGDVSALPMPDGSFDVVTAVTSLCFVATEARALAEMVRVARTRVVLGLLHRHSLLYLLKHGRGAYVGARWHTRRDVRLMAAAVSGDVRVETGLFWPGGPRVGRMLEGWPVLRRLGAFLAVALRPPGAQDRRRQKP